MLSHHRLAVLQVISKLACFIPSVILYSCYHQFLSLLGSIWGENRELGYMVHQDIQELSWLMVFPFVFTWIPSLVSRLELKFSKGVVDFCSNDVYDFETGADKNKKESVVKLIGRYILFLVAFNIHVFRYMNNARHWFLFIFWKSCSDSICCQHITCPWIHRTSLGICWSRRYAFHIPIDQRYSLWLCLSGLSMLLLSAS